MQQAQRDVAEARASGELALQPGERIEWAGQYQLLQASERRLRWIVPLVLISMLVLLYLQLGSFSEALIVLTAVPFALVGSVWALFLTGYALSAPVWIGLLSVFGLAMQTGVVMVVYIDAAFHQRIRDGRLETRDDIVAAHAEGTVQRLRPKLMTVITMAAGLLPLVLERLRRLGDSASRGGADARRARHQRVPDPRGAARAVHHLALPPAPARAAPGRADRSRHRSRAGLGPAVT